MAIDKDASIIQGTDIEPGLQFNTNGEVVARTLSIDWDFVPGLNTRTYASLRPTNTGVNSIRYRLRDGVPQPSNFGTLGVNLRAEQTIAPGGPFTVLLDSGVFVKPSGPDGIQLTAEGLLGASNNSGGTVEVGIIPDDESESRILGFSSLRSSYTIQPAPETLLEQFRVDFSRFQTANVRVTVATYYTNSNFGDASLIIRQGGTYNGVDGTIIASNTTIPVFFLQFLSLSTVIARPSGFDTIKILSQGPFIQSIISPALWIQEA